MSSAKPSASSSGPGFLFATFDAPFPIALPNGQYRCIDPIKDTAMVQLISREGCVSFFRDKSLAKGPTSFTHLNEKASAFDRPREEVSYVITAKYADEAELAILNLNTKKGFSEARYFTEISVIFLADEIDIEGADIIKRVMQILNPFLDKYRLVTSDYRVDTIDPKKNVFLTLCHASLLTKEEMTLGIQDLIATLVTGRSWEFKLGTGASNILPTGNVRLTLPSRGLVDKTGINVLAALFEKNYEMPLSYSLILEAMRAMQLQLDFRLAIIHAATAVEVHMLNALHNILIINGMPADEAWVLLEDHEGYRGATNRVKRLEQHTREYCAKISLPFKSFSGTQRYQQWDDLVRSPRNRAVHAGIASFSHKDAFDAIRQAKAVIQFIDNRIPELSNLVQLSSSMDLLKESRIGVGF